jgi:predicted dehydrogenase
MRIGIVGIGWAGKLHLDAWQAVPGVDVVAIAERAPVLRRWARDAGLVAYPDPLDMIVREDLDAVSICTPPAYHAQVAVACLERNLHVLCEKPLALGSRDALRMLRTATRRQRHLVLATKFRHVPDLIRARELIREGAVGDPIAFEIDFSSMVDMTTRWNSRRAISGGGVVIDNGCHAFDIVAFLFGTVSRVHATRLKAVQDMTVEDSATVLVAAGRGLIGRIELSWSLSTGRETYLTVYGSEGTLEIGWRGSRLRRKDQAPEVVGAGYDKGDAHRRMMTAFRDLVTQGGSPWITPGEIMRTVAAVEAAYRSMRSGGWASVDMTGMRARDGLHEARA